MANVTKKQINTLPKFGGAPYGNGSKLRFGFAAAANGAILDYDKATAPVVGDVLRMGILPAGAELLDVKSHVSAAFTALTTGKLGFAYVDGVDSAAVPQKDDYFNAALVLNAIGKTEGTNFASAPVRLPKDAYLILTWAGATNAAAGVLDVVIDYVDLGPQ